MPPKSDPDLIEQAKEEIQAMAKQGIEHPSTKPVIAGAVIGALGGALLPVVTWPIGLAVGAGFAFYNRLKR